MYYLCTHHYMYIGITRGIFYIIMRYEKNNAEGDDGITTNGGGLYAVRVECMAHCCDRETVAPFGRYLNYKSI